MALDRNNIDFLAVNTLPAFASWEIIEGGASVLVDTASLPPNSYIGHKLNAQYNDGLSSAEYRKLTLTLETKPELVSNYTTLQQLIVEIHLIYAVNTNSQINETDIVIVMNEDDIIENTDGTFTVQRIFQTQSRAIQECLITISNTGLNAVNIRDARLQRSADINVAQIADQINMLNEAAQPTSFKVYEGTAESNIIDGIGVIIASGLELKYKAVREGNRVSSIDTNFRGPIPVVYIPEYIDLSTNTDDNNTEVS